MKIEIPYLTVYFHEMERSLEKANIQLKPKLFFSLAQ